MFHLPTSLLLFLSVIFISFLFQHVTDLIIKVHSICHTNILLLLLCLHPPPPPPPPTPPPPPPPPTRFFFLGVQKKAIKTSRKRGESGGTEKERRKGAWRFSNTRTRWFRTGSDAPPPQEASVDRRSSALALSTVSMVTLTVSMQPIRCGHVASERLSAAVLIFCTCAGRLSSRNLTMDSKRK